MANLLLDLLDGILAPIIGLTIALWIWKQVFFAAITAAVVIYLL